MWNKLIAIMEHPTADVEVKKHAKMLLGQYNTAGGRRMKGEIESFLDEHKELL